MRKRAHKQRRRRRTTRCRTWNYSSRGWYFLTIVTHKRRPFFGYVQDHAMHLSPFGEVIMEEWNKSIALRPHMRFDYIIVMPEHVHMLVYIKKQLVRVPGYKVGHTFQRLPKSISSFMAQFKAMCVRQIRIKFNYVKPVWRPNYHDHIIRDIGVLRVRSYMRNNPKNYRHKRDDFSYNTRAQSK